jgi:hypothetical protein
MRDSKIDWVHCDFPVRQIIRHAGTILTFSFPITNDKSQIKITRNPEGGLNVKRSNSLREIIAPGGNPHPYT